MSESENPVSATTAGADETPDTRTALARRLAGLSPAEQEQHLVDMVHRHTVAALQAVAPLTPDQVDVQRPFLELGFDSLAAVDLHKRLTGETGLELPVTVAFDFPTPVLVAEEIRRIAFGIRPAPLAPVVATGNLDDDPIAIIGIGCRFPGGINSAEELWQLVMDEAEVLSGFPTNRGWDVEGIYDPDPGKPGKSYVREGGFLQDAGDFDADFFGISPREALAMDPQQRLVLETAWEAFERAGIDPGSLHGSKAGVFIGAEVHEYGTRVHEAPEGLDGYLMTGNAPSVASGRIAYSLGLEGPAVTIDTACSGSLVALHLAAHSLRQGESSLAIAGGVTVMGNPGMFAAFSRQRGLAADGRCKPFAAAADGTGFSEGVGVFVVERLADARRNGHPVLGIVKGSAINQDGASNGLTAPNGPSQQRLILQALANAGLKPADVDTMEAHGTGTKLGDPIEAQAILATYGQEREEGRPLWLGSIKSNLGHTQAAGGAASLIKMLMGMRHGKLPRSLHIDAPTPHVDWTTGDVALLTETRDWDAPDRPRRAGVSAFGISGTNAHVIIEEAPEFEPSAVEPVAGSGVTPPWVLSARSADALRGQAERLLSFVSTDADVSVVDVAYSLGVSRAGLEHRGVVLGESREELIAALESLASGAEAPGVVTGRVAEGRLAFLFTGQGAQRVGMGRELAAEFPVFAASLEETCDLLDVGLEDQDHSLREVLFAEEGSAEAALLTRTVYAQAALFAVEVALFRLVESFGVVPDFVAGHSVGEIAAAHVAGVFSLEDATMLVAARGRLMDALPEGGTMVAVQATEEDVLALLEGVEDASIAAINGPDAVVVSGTETGVARVVDVLRDRGAKTKRLDVSHAFHSPLMEPMLTEFRRVAEVLEYQAPRIAVVSNVSGSVAGTELATPEYWVTHVREAVRFSAGVRTLLGAGVSSFLEIGPDGVLSGMARGSVSDGADVGCVPVMRRGRGEVREFLTGLSRIAVRGVPVTWEPLIEGARRVELPTYAFQRRWFWLEAGRSTTDALGLGQTAAEHPLVGAVVGLAGGDGVVLTGRVSLHTHPWLADHQVAGVTLLPGTGFVELAVRAGDEVGCGRLEELTLEAPLVVPDRGAVQLQVVVGALEESDVRTVSVYSRAEEDDVWTRHATGFVGAAVDGGLNLEAWPPPGARAVDVSDVYAGLADQGYGYGPVFQGLRSVWRGDGEVFAEVVLPEGAQADASAFGLHPALLDAALHATDYLDPESAVEGTHLPFAWTGVSLHATGASELRVRITATGNDGYALDLADTTGRPVATVQSLVLRPVTEEQLRSAQGGNGPDSLFRVEWAPVTADLTASGAGWAVLGAGAPELAAALTAAGTPGTAYHGTAELSAAVDGGTTPDVVAVQLPSAGAADADLPDAVRATLNTALEFVQNWLADERLAETRLVVVTRDAVTVDTAAGGPDLTVAPVWGLIRSAQAENPGRILLADIDGTDQSRTALAAITAADEPELAFRNGNAYAPRLVRSVSEGGLVPPSDAASWRLDVLSQGTLENLALIPSDADERTLAPGEVRIAVRAAGVNFRDVLVALGMYPTKADIGGEAAGLVLEVGPGVTDFTPGDRVMGLFDTAFGPHAITDHRTLVPMPTGWTYAQAATAPLVFATAYYGLVDLAELRSGESALIHAAAGGVGMAAVQIARHLGAEVYGTASPGKWNALRAAGLDDNHIASSRDTTFEQKFLANSGGRGVDVVLDALTGEFIDASLRLLPRGGRFAEMGKTDVRDPERVAAEYPGVRYRAFDLFEADLDRLREILRELLALFESGALRPLPVRAWDIRKSKDAFRHIAQARHIGKVALTMPTGGLGDGVVLVTGGTGGLGALVARHVVVVHGVRRLVLVSRRGLGAPGAVGLVAELEGLGAVVEVVACDVSDRVALAGVVGGIGSDLSAVVHTAGVVDDGVVGSLSVGRLSSVLGPKADAAWYLHELTVGLDLSAFVLFSSVAGVVDGAGQGNYAAANVFLDGLAVVRRGLGLPGTSVAWGLWEGAGMGAVLGEADVLRMSRSGVLGLSVGEGLGLFDVALGEDVAALVPVRLDLGALRSRVDGVPAVFRSLVRVPVRRSVGVGVSGGGEVSLERRLVVLDAGERERVLLELVRSHVAAVLGYEGAGSIEPGRAFSDIGFDSLSAVELRNRLNGETGLRLPATLIFDYPTPQALAEYVIVALLGEEAANAPALPPTEAPTVTGTDDDPVVIVGMGCRFPGDVRTPEDLWRLVSNGSDAVTPFPDNRAWDIEGIYDPLPGVSGKTYAREGGFLHDAAEFDPEFFGISPREALAMDPQQRLLLETSWEAIERAGIDPNSLRGTQTGVFAGVMQTDYGNGGARLAEDVEGYIANGTLGSIVSGRVSYALGLEGPAVTIDTACSSSLVAMHWAAHALRQGECSLALAGGVTVMSTPETFVDFSLQRGLAPNGRCKAFSADADGTGWGEGVGVLVLERLSDARRNGHQVLAVIRGSALNQDGASNGLTAPNGPSQQRVIRQALVSAGLTTSDVDAVEAHGTGTTLGDPIEAQALLATYGQERDADQPLWLGSVKTNVGHTQAAAGVAGVIKMVLAMRAGVLPKTLHVTEPSPHVDWSAGAVELLTETRDWPETGRPRRAGVSSFGVSGTNAHVIVEQAPAVEEEPTRALPALPVPWSISAKSADALRGQAQALSSFVSAAGDVSVVDVAYSLGVSRAGLEHRGVVVGESRAELLVALESLASGVESPGVVTGRVAEGRLAFLFTGQGAQRVGMGRELAAEFPVFAASLEQTCDLLERAGVAVREVLFAEEGSAEAALLTRTVYAQAALFAVEVALFRLVESFGVVPDFVAGHSVGEIAAAHVAGVFSLEDAVSLVAARGRLMDALPEGGAMVAVQATEEDVLALLEGVEDASIAAINGPDAVVVSGTETGVARVVDVLRERGAKTKRLVVSHAFHSPLMEPMLADFATVVEGLSYKAPAIPVVSGSVVGSELSTPGYWVRHVREAVRFGAGVETLLGAGVSSFLEIGPDGVLSGMARTSVPEGADVECAPLMRRDRAEVREFLTGLSRLAVRGVPVAWESLVEGGRRVELPTYAFQRRRFWLEAGRSVTDASGLGQTAAEHPLVGAVVGLAGGDGVVLTGRVSLHTHPWLADHQVAGVTLLPGTGFVELAVRAGDEVGCGRLEELTLEAPLVVPDRGAVQLQVVVGALETSGVRTVSVYSRVEEESADDTWVRHATGALMAAAEEPGFDLTAWPPAGARAVDVSDAYAGLASQGYGYGPVFQGLTAAWRKGREVFAEITLPEAAQVDASAFGLHPALLDAALHATDYLDQESAEGTHLPFAWSGVSLHAAGASALRVRIVATGKDGYALDLADSTGRPVATVQSLVTRPVTADQLSEASATQHQSLFRMEWTATTAPAATADVRWALLGEPVAELGDLAGFGRTTAYASLADLAAADADTVPDLVVLPLGSRMAEGSDVPEAVRENLGQVLATIQQWNDDSRFDGSRLVVLTHGAVSVSDDESLTALDLAPVWGLVRSAMAETPGRFLLVDTDGTDPSTDALRHLAELQEAEFALREGEIRVPRLARVPVAGAGADITGGLGDGVVLVTGGTGGLGAVVARHAVVVHGVRRLVLVSRRGLGAPGAVGLVAELESLGAVVEVVACDVSDRVALAGVVGGIGSDLSAVVHTAGVVDDGVVGSLSVGRLSSVLGPKADAAWYLHELTVRLDLSAFVLFSSVAGVVDGAGQGNYAAANVFLDGLAVVRRGLGLPGTSVAWGLWEGAGMGAVLGEADVLRMSRSGVLGLSVGEGLGLFDVALGEDVAALVPVRLDLGALRSRVDGVPAVFRSLVRVPVRRSVGVGVSGGGEVSLERRLAVLDAGERERVLLELVRSHVAAVLGYEGAGSIEPGRAFSDIGFDSLSAVELRNRLNGETGLRLPATLIFDYPTPQALADLIQEKTLGLVDAAAATVSTTVSRTDDEPIAIVGMGCRYPGDVRTPEELWRLVASGTDAVSLFPEDRGWNVDSIYDPTPGLSGKTYTREGGFLHDAAEFDAGFFGISPREALAMDPQQRLLLETSWEAMERAGIDPNSLRGTQTGVFAGIMYHDYGSRVTQPSEEVEGYLGNGSAGSIASGRVSYTFGFEGPAVTVDTACSSSLVALHWAAQALRQGECSMALAGGVTVMSTPETFVDFSLQRGLATNGRCKAFSSDADGTGWGEGAGMLLLERLSDARKNGHEVLAVIRGSALNQDGASNGLTAPNGPSQQRVIRQALANAGLSAAEVDAVEAHGTGTKLGDPIEAQALLATYGQERDGDQPLLLGSIKSNVGHTQAAAGVGGVIKMVMAIRNGVLPKTLHVTEPSPHVDWSAGAVELLAEAREWPETGRPRRAGVSSFGISGTNAHVIVEQAPTDQPAPLSEPVGDVPGLPVPWIVSAKSAEALRAQAGRLGSFLGETGVVDVPAVGWSLVRGRSVFAHRAVVVGGEWDELLAGVARVAEGVDDSVVSGVADVSGRRVFVFPGQGSQWVGMAQGLLDSSVVFTERMTECAAALDPLVEWSLLDVVRGVEGAASLERVDVVQPVLWAVMVSLASVWRSVGVVPDAVVGHSQGEIAAAVVGGWLSLVDGARVVALRSLAIREVLAGGGGMVAVQAAEDEVAGWLEGVEGVGIAAVNGPRSVVISGTRAGLDACVELWSGRGTWVKRVPVDYASHSAEVERVRERVLADLASVTGLSGSVPMLSTMTGDWIVEGQVGAGYWVENLRRPVLFADATRRLASEGFGAFVEVSAHPVLVMGIEETIEALRSGAADGAKSGAGEESSSAVVAVGTLRRGEGGWDQFLRSLAGLFVRGAVAPDWESLLGGVRPRVDLPTYAFQRERLWLDAGVVAGDVSGLGQVVVGHPLLGAGVGVAGEGGGVLFTGRLGLGSHPWLGDHAVSGVVLLPGAAFVELVVRAGDEVGCGRLEELTLAAPLVVPERGSVRIQVVVGAGDGSGARSVGVWSSVGDEGVGGEWVCHASGLLTADVGVAPVLGGVWPPVGGVAVDVSGVYEGLALEGYEYGSVFRGLRSVWRRGDEVFAEVALGEGVGVEGFGLHPALLDAALQAAGFGSFVPESEAGSEAGSGGVRLPFSWSGVSLFASGASVGRVRLWPVGGDGFGVELFDGVGMPVARVDALVTREISAGQLGAAAGAGSLVGGESLFRVEWAPVSGVAPASAGVGGCVVVGAGSVLSGFGEVVPDLAAVSAGSADGVGVPGWVLVDVDAWLGADLAVGVVSGEGVPVVARGVVARVLGLVREWLGDERWVSSRLVWVTRGAVGARVLDEVSGVVSSGLWGLVRAAQSEHPDRFALLDLDSATAVDAVRDGVLGLLAAGEPQLVVREGEVLAARLTPAHTTDEPTGQEFGKAATGTVLVTGGTGGLGAVVARHLVTEHGAQRLLLTSRRGINAPGAAELVAELAELGARADVAACDVSDRAALKELLAGVPGDAPLTAVVHAAGVLDDGVIESMTADRLDAVMRPKVDAAWHLHELTADRELDAFVLFSSAAGTLDGAGQSNYAAANVFLDALAQYRRGQGLAGLSLAWGLWGESTGMVGALEGSDLDRIGRSGVRALSSAEGLALFDAAAVLGEPAVLPVALDLGVLRTQPRNQVPAILRGFAAGPTRRTAVTGGPETDQEALTRRLASLSPADRDRFLLDLVRTQVAGVLGYSGPDAIDPQRGFQELGVDSLAAVQIRNRLGAATGVRPPTTLVFDYPTPDAVAGYFKEHLVIEEEDSTAELMREIARLEAAVTSAASSAGGAGLAPAVDRLRAMAAKLADADAQRADEDDPGLESATADELFDILDGELSTD
uniref:Polyketide synthase modules 1-3 n=2 Tax=Streptomyces TaxID=1883 RepID=Q76KY0_STRHA|nr:polyketide synthase modules 1-3 [Streptomyces halstedii]